MSAAIAAGTLRVRVTIEPGWQLVAVDAGPLDTVAAVKMRALRAAHVAPDDAADYEVKSGGALIQDESQNLPSAGVKDGGALMVQRRRRRAIR